MKTYLLLLLVLISLYSCKEDNPKTLAAKKEFYPHTEKLEVDYSYFITDDDFANILFKKNKRLKDNQIQFYQLQEDTIIKESFNYRLPHMYMNMVKIDSSYFILHTNFHTMGKQKTHDVITKYDKTFKVVNDFKIDMNRQAPSKSFILKNSDIDFIYVSTDLKYKELEKLYLQKFSPNINVIGKAKKLISKTVNHCYRPILVSKVDKGILIISDVSSYNSKDKIYEMLKLDLDFNVLWKKELEVKGEIKKVFDFKEARKIVIVYGEDNDQNMNFYNYNGKLTSYKKFPNQTFINIRSNKGSLYSINELKINDTLSRVLYKLDTLGGVEESKIINKNGIYRFTRQRIVFANDKCYIFQLKDDKLKISPVMTEAVKKK